MYAHLITPTTISRNPPRQAVIDGRFVTGELPEAYLNSQNWYRLTETPMPENPQEGYHYEARYAYDSDEAPTAIVQSWEVVQDAPPPPRVFSKLKLKGAIATAGLLPAFKELLSGMEVAPGYTAKEAFDDAVNLSEAHPKFADAIAVAKQTLPVTDEQIEAILAASVAD
jgi:hypothetical protein